MTLLSHFYDKQDSVQETTQEQEARREASTTSERRASARIAARQQHALDVNSAKLNLVKTDRCRKELERLLTFHDKIRAMPFEPEQLFSLLCAAYPYDPTNSRVSTRISHESATTFTSSDLGDSTKAWFPKVSTIGLPGPATRGWRK